MRLGLGSLAIALLVLGCTNTTSPPASTPASPGFLPGGAGIDTVPPDAAMTTLLPEDASRQHATLESEDGKSLCDLPCTGWILPWRGLRVRVDEGDSSRRVEVPYAEAADKTVVVLPKRGHPGAGPWLIGGSVIPLAFGSVLLMVCKSALDTPPGQDRNGTDADCIPGVVVTSLGVSMLAAGVIFALTGRYPRLEVVGQSAQQRSTSHGIVAPAGLGGTF